MAIDKGEIKVEVEVEERNRGDIAGFQDSPRISPMNVPGTVPLFSFGHVKAIIVYSRLGTGPLFFILSSCLSAVALAKAGARARSAMSS